MGPKPNQPPLVVVVGETASGKSSLGIKIAQKFNGEIICADSWTVRREVNIGTAKPTAQEQSAVPHHLIDVAGACDDFSAAVFKRLAAQAINGISGKGKLPVMVGGTGLYIDSVLFDYGFLPAATKQRREGLNSLTIGQLLAQIEQKGLSLDGIDTRNKRRLIRVLESGGQRPTSKAMRPNTLIIGIARERNDLRQRVTHRVDNMLEQGLEQEAKSLSGKYGWNCEALKGIGYQEWRDYFAGTQSLETVRGRIIKDTMDLAKRQRTWFKRNKSINWICNFEEAVDLCTTFLNK